MAWTTIINLLKENPVFVFIFSLAIILCAPKAINWTGCLGMSIPIYRVSLWLWYKLTYKWRAKSIIMQYNKLTDRQKHILDHCILSNTFVYDTNETVVSSDIITLAKRGFGESANSDMRFILKNDYFDILLKHKGNEVS